MVTNEPQVSLSGRYSIEETCKHLGIDRSTLRRYTNKGKIKYGVRKATSRKFYLGSEIIRLWRTQL